jgi:hypothetical protein
LRCTVLPPPHSGIVAVCFGAWGEELSEWRATQEEGERAKKVLSDQKPCEREAALGQDEK